MYLYTSFFFPLQLFAYLKHFFHWQNRTFWLSGSFSIGHMATAGKPGNCLDFVQLWKKTAFLLGLKLC